MAAPAVILFADYDKAGAREISDLIRQREAVTFGIRGSNMANNTPQIPGHTCLISNVIRNASKKRPT